MQKTMNRLLSWGRLLAVGVLCTEMIAGCAFRTTGELTAYEMVRRFAGDAAEIPFWTGRFQSDKGRWPKDFKELQTFVSKKSNGRLTMTYYDRVAFVELPGGRLQVDCFRANKAPVQYTVLPEAQGHRQ